MRSAIGQRLIEQPHLTSRDQPALAVADLHEPELEVPALLDRRSPDLEAAGGVRAQEVGLIVDSDREPAFGLDGV
jgi:hypothetical protein